MQSAAARKSKTADFADGFWNDYVLQTDAIGKGGIAYSFT